MSTALTVVIGFVVVIVMLMLATLVVAYAAHKRQQRNRERVTQSMERAMKDVKLWTEMREKEDERGRQ